MLPCTAVHYCALLCITVHYCALLRCVPQCCLKFTMEQDKEDPCVAQALNYSPNRPPPCCCELTHTRAPWGASAAGRTTLCLYTPFTELNGSAQVHLAPAVLRMPGNTHSITHNPLRVPHRVGLYI